MDTETTGQGTCTLCSHSDDIVGMEAHLETCLVQNSEAQAIKNGKQSVRFADRDHIMHVVVFEPYVQRHWLHLAIRTDTALQDLDQFLRDLWLECCGHLSHFAIDGTYYERLADFSSGRNMEVAIGTVISPEQSCGYEYDFGDTTALGLYSYALYTASATANIRLLARNDAPVLSCDKCGALATKQGYTESFTLEPDGVYCDACAKEYDDLYPILNSPRSGVCDYGLV